jgi:acyl-CoA thioester hydrolase
MKAWEQRITAAPDDIDELGHVNNAVWVRWIQDVATAHWHAVANAADTAAYFWVVTRHEIDYLRALEMGQSVTARTWIEGPPKGARSVRCMEFVGDDCKVHVRARTDWAMLDRATGRPVRVAPEIVAPFLA